MPESESKSSGKKPGKGIAMDGSHLKVPTTGTTMVRTRDGSNLKVPPKPTTSSKTAKE
jgi:hypothetical protein